MKLAHLDRQQLAALGEVHTPSIADLFVAVMADTPGQVSGRPGPANLKERLDEYSIERHARVSSRIASRRARGHLGDSALYWSVRRELWENRSIYIAPLAVAALFLFGFLISTIQPAGQDAPPVGARPRATTRSDRAAVLTWPRV